MAVVATHSRFVVPRTIGVLGTLAALVDGGTAFADEAECSSSSHPPCMPIVKRDAPPIVVHERVTPTTHLPETYTRRGIDDWEDRHGVSFEVGLGAAGGIAGLSPTFTGFGGGLLLIGMHHHVRWPRETSSDKGDVFGSSESFRWCVPVLACGGIGMIFAPVGSVLANDFGVELRVGGVGEGGAREGAALRASVRPTLRYANGPFRTGTFVGALIPEVGLAVPTRPSPVALLVAWPLYPIDFIVVRGWAIAVDPLRAGIYVPLGLPPQPGAGTVGLELGTEITFRWLP